MNELLIGTAGKKIGVLLSECQNQCLNSDHNSFEEKLEIWENHYLQVHLIYTGITQMINDNRVKNELRKHTFINTINVFTGIFLLDFISFKYQSEGQNNRIDLKNIYEDKIIPIDSSFSKIISGFDLTAEVLSDVNLPPEINTEVWSMNKELPKLVESIRLKLSTMI